jgi:malate dehydrogenase
VVELACFDVANAPGVAANLSHIPTKCHVYGSSLEDNGLEKCLKGADLVVIPAGVPRKPGMTRDDPLNINASIVKTLTEGCATHCPNAISP